MDGPEEDPDQRTPTRKERLSSRLADDQFYRALASTQPRRILYYLLANGESTTEELASVLSGWEVTTTTATMHTPADRSAILIQLVHQHLPLLADADLVDYDRDDSTVQIHSLHTRVESLIQQSIEAEHSDDSG